MRTIRLALVTATLLATVVACESQPDLDAVSGEVSSILSGPPAASTPASVWTDTQTFYTARSHAPVWVTSRGLSKRAAAAREVIRSAAAHGLEPEQSDEQHLTQAEQALARADEDDRPRRLAEYDIRLTTAMLRVGRDVALGRTAPAQVDRRWKARRQSPDFPGALARAVDGDLDSWLSTLAPAHAEYGELQKGLAQLEAQEERGGWPVVPATTFKIGETNPAVRQLRQRLAASGDLDVAQAQQESVYDDALKEAVRKFQERHGLTPDGLAGRPTIAAMNVPLQERVRQLRLNLDRWRWMPDDLGDRHLFVNIPSFDLRVREQRTDVLSMRVVVGKPGNETPIFSGEMETVVFSPYWNIPDTIVEGETAPAIARDPDYIRRNNLEILRITRSGAQRLDPDDVNWDNPEELRQLAFRQRPGPGNALGHVKFLFPNPYSVYLHDTPADRLFSRQGRAFSHGCVRVEEPKALAEYVLRNDPAWTSEKIDRAMHSGDEQHVRLPAKLPVHIAYFTAWPDGSGGVRFHPDIYRLDIRQATPLARR